MSTVKAKLDYSKNGPNDEYYTPIDAVEMIIPLIPKHIRTIWECTAIKESCIVEVLRSIGYNVISSHIDEGKDFLTYEPVEDYDIIITNPPYSKKDEFLRRAYELKKPFMFLLPITTLEGIVRHKLFKEYGIQLIIPDCRFRFKPGGSGAWFQTSWFTYGLKLDKDLNFISVKSPKTLSANVKTKSISIHCGDDEFHQVA